MRVQDIHRLRRRRQPEAALQRALIDHLRWRAPSEFAFHVPNGGWRSPVEASILAGLGLVRGMPDVGIIEGGRAFWLELKSVKGRLSPAQIATHERLRAAGCEVATVSTVDAALAQLAAWGIVLRGSAP